MVHSSVGYSPAELLFGNALSLERGVLSVAPGSSLKEYPEYVKQLCKFQAEAIAASQVHLAQVQDHKVQNAQVIAGGRSKKSFAKGDFVLAKRFDGEKLDLFYFVDLPTDKGVEVRCEYVEAICECC
jgi:hypothetical protein